MENINIKSKQEIVNGNIELAKTSSQISYAEFNELLNKLKGTEKEILIDSISKHVNSINSYFLKSLDLIKIELNGEPGIQEIELSKIQQSYNQKMEEYKTILLNNTQEKIKKID